MVINSQHHHRAVVRVVEEIESEQSALGIKDSLASDPRALLRNFFERANFFKGSMSILPNGGAHTEIAQLWRSFMEPDAPAALSQSGSDGQAA
jgi:hypothetical protein